MPLSPSAVARERYQSALDKLIERMRKEYERELGKLLSEFAQDSALSMDANLGSQARILLNKLSAKWQSLFNRSASRITDRMIEQVDRSAKANLGESLKKLSGGLTIQTPDMPAGLQDVITASIAENVALIKSVAVQYHDRIASAVFVSIQSGGQSRATVLEELRKIGGMSDRRAKLIARDQVSKVTTQMNAERAKSVGMRKFQWLHSRGGAEPRKLHQQLDGQIFSYDDLPVIDERTGERGLPGQLINCRCQAIPVIDFGDGED